MSKKQKKMLQRIIAAAILLVVVKLLPPIPYVPALLLFLIPYAIIGWDVLWRAIRNIRNGQVFDENFLMAIATIGAFGTGEYQEAVFVMLFYQVGELFQSYAVGKSRQSIAALMDICPDTANLELEDGSIEEVDPEDVEVDAIIVVKPGERIPLDGTIVEGTSVLDTAALTGESMPRDVTVGDPILSGCVNLSGLLRVRVTAPCEESTVTKILEMVENASDKKAVTEQFITRFARYYTPCVVIAATALFLIPSLFLWFMNPASLPGFLAGTVWTDWLHRALIFLVISCPCALVISVPMGFFGGIGAASKCGILVKGSNYLELMAQAETVVFDKTGTLTEGFFTVTEIKPQPGFDKDSLLTWAALAERYSDHPISLSLRRACPVKAEEHTVDNVEELAGHGVRATVDGHPVLAGNDRLMAQAGITLPAQEKVIGTLIHVAVDGVYAGSILAADRPKEGIQKALQQLKASGVKRTVMLTGDRQETAAAVAKELGVDEFRAELLPADKVERLEELLKETSGKLAFVGDGINDAPVLSRADVGIAMGALGSDAAIEAADIVLMDDQPAKIATSMAIARKTLRVVKENIWFALGIKGLVLVLGALGLANMWMAVFADVGVAVIAILNATRCLNVDTQA